MLVDIDKTKNKYYIRVNSSNKPGVIGDLGLICGKNNINLCSIIQKGILEEENSATIVMLTEHAYEQDVKQAIKEIAECASTNKVENIIRVME
ncbi:MAG: ACT domain-containing protein [Bacillus subtilis]|nr:ACT domain-containing protein [Bacillus subtilis]